MWQICSLISSKLNSFAGPGVGLVWRLLSVNIFGMLQSASGICSFSNVLKLTFVGESCVIFHRILYFMLSV